MIEDIETQGGGGDRDWSDVSTSQGTPRIAGSLHKLREGGREQILSRSLQKEPRH